MITYFENKNEQLVPQKIVAEDLRKHLDVKEGLRCLIYGKPEFVSHEHIGFYQAYLKTAAVEEGPAKGGSDE